jgi:L-cysteate sulfo-lyase
MHLSRFPRIRFTHAPTPLEPMPNLTRHLGGPALFVKRDDCTGLALGGNKVRKLEFLIGDALAQGATHVVTHGATQSNHVRQTAAAACKVGLRCTALLEERVTGRGLEYEANGNVLLDRILGCALESRPDGLDMAKELAAVGERLRAAGEKPYLIPGGGSTAVGALGYVVAAQEILVQANDMGLRVDRVVHATGSAGTQSGLVAGFQGLNSGIRVLGICIRSPKVKQEEKVWQEAQHTWELLGIRGSLPRESVEANPDWIGPGYGQPTEAMVEAVTLAARLEGLFLDPVYTGKAMAGLIGLVRSGYFRKGENVVFVHTGGAVGLFGYRDVFPGAGGPSPRRLNGP